MGLLSNFFKGGKQSAKANEPSSLQEQLATFESLGFRLNEDIDRAEILEMAEAFSTEDAAPYSSLYITLGCLSEETGIPFCNQCWDFDTEAIEDHGAYVDILENISRITNGALTLSDIEDYVDIEEETAWVSFTCQGETYKWDMLVDNDWVDLQLFDKIRDLAARHNSKGKFTYFDTGGQDFVLGFHSPQELEKIRKTTGLKIVWLNPLS